MILFTISGTDGSGKSTQLGLLRERLEKEGLKVAYFHAIEFSLANRLARLLKGKRDFTPGSEKANVSASPFSVLLRTCMLLADLAAFRIHILSSERKGYDILLSDRYFYDSVVNILYLSRQNGPGGPSPVIGIALRIAETCIIRPNAAFFLDIDPESVMRRDRTPEQGTAYLEAKRDLFRNRARAWSLIPIDADRPKEEIFSEISRNIARILGNIDKKRER